MGRPRKQREIRKCKMCDNTFEVLPSSKKIYCSKKCANADIEVKNKIIENQKKTFDTKYGKHPMQTEKTKRVLKQSLLKKYNVEHYSKTDDFSEKVKQTKLKRYGDENYNNLKKIKQTCLKKYGVENFRQSELYEKQYKETCLKKYKVPHASKSEQYKFTHKKLMFEKFLKNERFKNFEPMFSIDEYDGLTIFNKKYKFKCKKCNTEHYYYINNGKSIKCINCENTISSFQNEIYSFIKKHIPDENIIINDRTVIKPNEIDILIPSLKFGIECNGIFYHSEISGGKNSFYHLNKTKQCIMNGINLIHIMDCEWKLKQDIIKSIIKQKLNININKIYARNCIIKEISNDECKHFLNKNHLQGNCISNIKLALLHKNEIVCVMTFNKSRFTKKYEYELIRYCNKIDLNVVGGASKLFNYFIKSYNPQSIISFCDRRMFDGKLYLKLNFNFIETTKPSYYYIENHYSNTKNRMTFMKYKLKNLLEKFDPNLSEWENMKNHGYDRIWDCGNLKWAWKNTKY